MSREEALALVGLVGWPLGHSLSPRLMNAVFARRRLPFRYEAFPVRPADLGREVARLRDLGVRGLNVTVPHKETVIEFLDDLAPEARAIGAANCVEAREGRWRGHNTDAAAFAETLAAAAGFRAEGKRAVVLGAGGAARAVAFALAAEGAAEITVLARRQEQAEALATDLVMAPLDTLLQDQARARGPAQGVPPLLRAGPLAPEPGLDAGHRAPEAVREALETADLLVNATPAGMEGGGAEDEVPLPYAGCLRAGLLVYDLVYGPSETPLLRAARERGAAVQDGLAMLAFQAAAALRLWTGAEMTGHEMLTLARELTAG